uniref:Uncharacterized protein n=1 Tax=Anguilla anguilla TaxID=7936 RepID=A0A0E9SPS7_ANGAN
MQKWCCSHDLAPILNKEGFSLIGLHGILTCSIWIPP